MSNKVKGLFLRNKIWWMSFVVDGQRYRESTGTPNKRLAESILAKQRILIAENRFLDVRRESHVIFRDFADEYLEKHAKPHKRSWKGSDANSIKHLNRVFGGLPLSKITQDMIEEYVRVRRSTKIEGRLYDGKERCLSPASVNRELACLKTMLNKAVEWGKLETSPCVRVRKLKENNARTRFLTEAEMERLMKAVSPPELADVIAILLHTGMRKGELQGLKWADVDFDHGLITLTRTKNGKVRHIPMNEVTKQVLLRRRIAKKSDSWVFPGTKPDKPWDFYTAFDMARAKAGLKDVRLHDLRHTFAAHLCMRGADLMTVKELLGHHSLEMTQRYMHLTERHRAEAVARLEGLPVNLVTIQSQSDERNENAEFEKIVSPLKSSV
jgi:integrase